MIATATKTRARKAPAEKKVKILCRYWGHNIFPPHTHQLKQG
jgi:hypothetical protein